MAVPHRARTAITAAAFLLGACDRSPGIAVIGMHGVPADARYLGTVADSFLAGPHPVRVEIFDGGNSHDAYHRALQVAEDIVKTPNLVAVVGHRDSRSTLVVGPVYRDAGVPLVVPNATSHAIQDLGPLVFRMAADDTEEGAFLAHVAVGVLGARRITVFHVADEFGIGIRDGFEQALAREQVAPMDVVEYGLHRTRCPDDFQALVEASLLRGVPDLVLLGGRTPDAACIVRIVSALAPSARFLAADGVDPTRELREVAGPAADNLRIAQFWSPEQGAASRAFADGYARRGGALPDQGTALRWDAVRMLVAAVTAVGPSRARVARYLRELGRSRPPFHGVTGDISFGARQHALALVDAEGRPVPDQAW